MGSLLHRLLIGCGGVIALALLTSSAVIYSRVNSTLHREFDQRLYEKASLLSSLTELTEEGLDLDISDEEFREYRDSSKPTYYQAWQADGTVLGRSANLRQKDLHRAKVERKPVYSAISLPDGRAGRQVGIRFFPRIDEELLHGSRKVDVSPDIVEQVAASPDGRIDQAVTIVVAASTDEVKLLISRLFKLLTGVGVVSVGLSLGLIYAVIWKSLRPLQRVADKIESIDAERLGVRIDEAAAPDEIVPLVNRLNELLGRLETVMQRERAFSSDVSHELRTPLAGIRSTIEVCLSKARDSKEYVEALRVCRKICGQSQRMVESLLEISRLETGHVGHDIRDVDLTQFMNDCLADFEAQAAAKGVTMQCKTVEPALIETDQDKLRVVFRNLVENAVRCCDNLGRISVSSMNNNGSVVIAIENTGNTLTPEQLPHICDRFWRGDEARAQTGEHFGLGLSLAQKLVVFLGGRLDLTVSGPVFRASVSLPLQRYDT